MSNQVLTGSQYISRKNPYEEKVPTLIRLFVYLFIISLPFNQFTTKIITPTDNFTKYAGFLLIIMFFLVYKFRFSFPTISSRLFLLFFVYTSALEFFRYLYIDSIYQRSLLSAAFQHFQVAGLFFVFANVTRDKKVVYRIIDIFIVINIIKALILTFNLKMFMVGFERETGRYGILGENLNQTALYLSLTLFIFLSRLINRKKFDGTVIFYILAIALLAYAITKTGSRGGAIVLLAGVILIFAKHFNTQNFFKNVLLISTIVYFAVTFITETTLYERFLDVFRKRDTGYRLELINASFELLKENYVIGFGSHYPEILGNYLGKTRIQAHNTYLQLLMSFGVIGFLLFLIAFAWLFKEIYYNQNNLIGSTILIMFITFLFSFGTSGLAANKTLWVFLAIFSNITIWNSQAALTQKLEPTLEPGMITEKQYA